ncbi:hypothetical protein [Loktanella sp. 3ANDIMAR09]|uniref:hypothetical protein n=1 Tax=Loktanella sp. 3ANDIMAR09 TaxID=1225657 RepID=UPI0012EDD233|nr:hypothetical protein [Loktanella sp. 3ANDIMAR09]
MYETLRRVRLNGERTEAGQPIEIDGAEAKRLVAMGAIGPAQPGSGGSAAAAGDGGQSQNGSGSGDDPDQVRLDAIATAVAPLGEDAFKKDGLPRADTLKALEATLGFVVTDDDVKAAQDRNTATTA